MRSRSDPLSVLANPRCLSPQAVDALKKSLAPKANAKRNGKWVVVKGVELVLPTMAIGRTHYGYTHHGYTCYQGRASSSLLAL